MSTQATQPTIERLDRIQVEAYACRNANDVRRLLRSAETPRPSLHPDIASADSWTRWNGWNRTVASGCDAQQQAVTASVMHCADGHDHIGFEVVGDSQRGGDDDFVFEKAVWPLTLFAPSSVIDSPEYTEGYASPKGYVVTWQSTPEERYSTDMMERAEQAAKSSRYVVDFLFSEGGTNGDEADNHIAFTALSDKMAACFTREMRRAQVYPSGRQQTLRCTSDDRDVKTSL